MAAPFFSTPMQPYVYQGPDNAVTPFQILGGDGQIVQIMMKSHELVTAKPGTMCYTSGSIHIDYIYPPGNGVGLWQWLFGKSVTNTIFYNPGPDYGFVGIAAPLPAQILPIDLARFGGEIICQSDAFLCSVSDVILTHTYDRRARHEVPSAELILPQKLMGQGLAFMIGGGSVVQKSLEDGEVLTVDAACIVAMTTTITFELKHSNPVRGVLFRGDRQLTAHLMGPGIVFLQSLPFKRLSQNVSRSLSKSVLVENPKFFLQLGLIFLLAYAIILVSLLLTDA
ncbi:hypothetical protein J5N97_016068 [Dioscorea zingiberensis]|uniref:Altered inheritance of mitochondria protein 24, mitochondrial n=1 Tax=Dioscorea zingiberensis TaxID=325984 RepID=A0A9D5HF99_9LILI|nr:hypothetical protein J5N97_016068 [Dioscorea zingiberensis]